MNLLKECCLNEGQTINSGKLQTINSGKLQKTNIISNNLHLNIQMMPFAASLQILMNNLHTLQFLPPKMLSPSHNMLYIQQSNSLNTTRMIPVATLTQALEKMMGLYVQIKFNKQKGEQVMFDIQQAIDYFQTLFEIRYLQEMGEQQPQMHFCNFQMKTMKILNKKNLLDQFVDHYSNIPNDNPEMVGQSCS